MQQQNESTRLLPGMLPSQVGQRTAFCPEDHRLAAWFERRLGIKEAQDIERHLPECAFCRSRIGLLGRLEQEPIDESISEDLLARAKQLASSRPPKQRRWALAWGAAAVITLGLGLLVNSKLHLGPVPQEQPAVPAARQLRSVEASRNEPVILRPAAEAILESGSLDVKWTPVDGSLHYELLLMDDAGRLLVAQRLQATEWRSGGDLGLAPGGNYFIRVNAYLADGRTQGSRHTAFSVSSTRAAAEPVEK